MAKSKLKMFDEILSKHILKKDFVKVIRTVKGEDKSIYGFIVAYSRDFILIHSSDEFLLNGYNILRKDQFDSVRCNVHDRSQRRIMKAEGILEQVGAGVDINLQSWKNIFQSIKKLGFNVIIECEDLEEPLFEIGPIKKSLKTQVHIQYHDPSGILEQADTAVNYDSITLVTFGDRYSVTFKKYLKLP